MHDSVSSIWKGTHAGTHRRDYTRWPCSAPALLVSCDVGESQGVEVACRDISTMGAGLRTPNQVRIASKCVVVLRSRIEGSAVAVPGVVARCVQVRDGLFDVGVRFDKPLELDHVIWCDPFAGYQHENVEAIQVRAGLQGQRVGVVSGSEFDSAMVRALLGFETVFAPTSREDLAKNAATLGVVIVEAETPCGDVAELAIDLFCSGFTGKMILLTPAASDGARRLLEKLPFASVILRPLHRASVLGALADAIKVEGQEGAKANRLAA